LDTLYIYHAQVVEDPWYIWRVVLLSLDLSSSLWRPVLVESVYYSCMGMMVSSMGPILQVQVTLSLNDDQKFVVMSLDSRSINYLCKKTDLIFS